MKFAPVWTDILNDLEPLRGSSKKKTYSTRKLNFFGMSGPVWNANETSQRKLNLHTSSLNKLLLHRNVLIRKWYWTWLNLDWLISANEKNLQNFENWNINNSKWSFYSFWLDCPHFNPDSFFLLHKYSFSYNPIKKSTEVRSKDCARLYILRSQ
jgi:hypothetical protein